MTPQTRSRGVPPPSRVYNSTPAQQQVRFTPRRKIVRTYGKQNKKKQEELNLRTMRQQTLTQIDFVSSFEGGHDPITLSDSEEEELEYEIQDKENDVGDQGDQIETEDDDDPDQGPASSSRKRRASSRKTATGKATAKRRRTLGNDPESEIESTTTKNSNRRKTTGEAPSSSYHTQTLTQFLGRDGPHPQYIRDSEDEDEGFQEWLGLPTNPEIHNKVASPVKRRQIRFAPNSQHIQDSASHDNDSTREESIIPQTPRKRAKSVEIPSSSQLSTPPSISSLASFMVDRYGPPGQDPSPVKNLSSPARAPLRELPGQPRTSTTPRRHGRIIQDSYATDSWESIGLTPPRRGILQPLPIDLEEESSSLSEVVETPTKLRWRGESTELGERTARLTSPSPGMKRVSPGKGKKSVLLEIPDSEDEGDGFDDSAGGLDDDEDDEDTFIAGSQTQLVMSEIASSEEELARKTPTPPNDTRGTASATSCTESRPQPSKSTSPPRALAPSSQPTTFPLPSSPSKPPFRHRKPVHRPLPPTQTQPLESQRVPIATLQSLPPASARSDILLPITQEVLDGVLEGFQVDITLPFKIPTQVVRFWLFEDDILRFMACAEHGRVTAGPAWSYRLVQVYELNNPMEGDDIREEGWVDRVITRYSYIPPAVVGQLLWNLRHAIFRNAESQCQDQDQDQDGSGKVDLFINSSQPMPAEAAPAPTPSISVSQQVEAQLQSDIANSTQVPTSDDILVPSTPEVERPSKTTPRAAQTASSPTTIRPPRFTASSFRASRPAVRPSQTTTASQASTPDGHSSYVSRTPAAHSSGSLGFDDGHGPSSPIQMPQGYISGSSQLLTKSQMLPDSLVRDDMRIPGEIWDSDDEGDTRLWRGGALVQQDDPSGCE